MYNTAAIASRPTPNPTPTPTPMIVPFLFPDAPEDAVCRGTAELEDALELVLDDAINGADVAGLVAIVTVCVAFG